MSRIREFYNGKTIFVTGGTGFMGKVLIEKLLYSCSELKQIFLLMRLRNDQNLDERMEDLVNSPVFDRLKQEKPQTLRKIVPVHGDVELRNLGISNEDLQLVLVETQIIFNVAAAVNFLEPIESSFTANTLSFIHLVEISKKMKNLQNLMHVSTGFCFRNRENIEEKFYNFEQDNQWILHDLDRANDNLSTASNNKLHGHQCTYSYTKRLAEIIANEEYNNLPICIVRPSIGKLIHFFNEFSRDSVGWNFFV